MAHIIVLDHAFNFPRSARSIPRGTANFLQRLSFNGEGNISASQQLSEFNEFFDCINVSDENERCRMLNATFEGRIRSWYEFLPAKSIHSWK